MIGSGSWTRTNDPVVNSHLLYQLSYAGIIKSILKVGRVRIELTQPMAPVLQTGVTLQLYRLPRNKNPLSRVELDLSLRESNPLHPVRCATLAQGDISILNGD